METTRYASRGVSTDKEEVHDAISHLDPGLFPSAFCKIVPDIAGDPAWCTIMHADGPGSKAALAYLAQKHGFPINVWKGIAQDGLVMNTDDVACAGVTFERMYVNQTINRNKFKISGEVLAARQPTWQTSRVL